MTDGPASNSAIVPSPRDAGAADAVTRFCAGDDDAFREIVVAWHVRLQTMIAGAGVPLEDVPLVAQDVFLHVYDNVNDFTPGTNFRAWLYAIARNKVRAYHEVDRRQRRNLENALEHFLTQQVAKSQGLEDRIDALNQCLAKLSKPLRKMVRQRYTGTSVKELARISGRSESAVKMSLLRTREALRECIMGIS